MIVKEKTLAARVPEPVYKDFRIECFKRGVSVKKAMLQAVKGWLEKKQGPSLAVFTNRKKVKNG